MIKTVQFTGVEFDGYFVEPGFYFGKTVEYFGFNASDDKNGTCVRTIDDDGDKLEERAISRKGWLAVETDFFDAFDDDPGRKPDLGACRTYLLTANQT
jgi:hypothetical protein